MNIFKVCLKSLLSLFLVVILIVNIFGCLGLAGVNWVENFTGVVGLEPNYSENNYFGFTSLINAFNDFPYDLVLGEFNGLHILTQTLTNFVDSVKSFVITNDLFQLVELIVRVLISPITILADITSFAIMLISYTLSIIMWLLKVWFGYYNIPLPNTIS